MSTEERSLAQHIQKLEESLEDTPDPWFNAPKGWLKKPDFKREDQKRDNVERRSSIGGPQRRQSIMEKAAELLGFHGYKDRWFVLDVATRTVTYYKDYKDGTPPSGIIDMSRIVDIQESSVHDAPEFALDLISIDKHFTLVAATHATMVRWAYAFNLARARLPTRRTDLISAKSKGAPAEPVSDVKWSRYDVVYESQGPLMLNVVGTSNTDRKGNILNNWIIVTSFENYPDGTPGRSELSGMISVKDYVVGVNGTDLTTFTFNDAMDAIVGATWPKTLHFLRDNTASREAPRVESWAYVYYPSLNRRRRRYVELRWDAINFRKPTPGGSATAKRDAYFCVDQIQSIRLVEDKTMPFDQQFILQINCAPSAVVDHVGDDDTSMGGSPVETLELCFPKLQSLNIWRSALVSPSGDVSSAVAPNITVLPMEVIDAADVSLDSSAAKVIGIKSELTGRFAPRAVTLSGGFLKWHRASAPRVKFGSKKGFEKTLFIANSSTCALINLKALSDPLEERAGFKYQLTFETFSPERGEQAVTLGMADEATIMEWISAVAQVVAASKPETLIIPTTIEPITSTGKEDDEEAGGPVLHEDDNRVQGYLFYRSNPQEKFQKRWFTLEDLTLSQYKTSSEAEFGSTYLLGTMDLRAAIEVREAADKFSPENSIEIVTASRVYTLVAEDEESQLKWLEWLGDTLEMRSESVQGEKAAQADPARAARERVETLRKAIVRSGLLNMKSVNRITSSIVWKLRYFVLANGSLSYHDKEDDYFDIDKDCLGDIPCVNVTLLESSIDPKATPNMSFDMHARVGLGGDRNGMRVFTLTANSANTCREWMEAIAKASGRLEMKPKENGVGYISVVSKDAMSKRTMQKRQSLMGLANTKVLESPTAGQRQGEEGHMDPPPPPEDVTNEEDAAELKRNALMRRTSAVARRPSAVLGGRTGGRQPRRPSTIEGEPEPEPEPGATDDTPNVGEDPSTPTVFKVFSRRPSALDPRMGRGGRGIGGRGSVFIASGEM